MQVNIITGASCSGKSVLLNYLKELKFDCIGESATTVIKKRKSEGRYLPWEVKKCETVWEGFQREVFDKQICLLNSVGYTDVIFMDRSFEDILVHFKLHGYYLDSVPFWWIPTMRADNIFILRPVQELYSDGFRNPYYNQKDELELLISTYQFYFPDRNICIEDTPKTTTERIQWILSKCQIKGK